MAAALGIDSKRAALAGGYFQSSAYSDTFALSDPEYTTPSRYRCLCRPRPYQRQLSGAAQQGARQALPQREPYGAGAADDEWVPLFRSHRPQRQKPAASDRREAQCVLWLPAIPAQLAINGAEAAPSALIHAGDRIHFTPAQPGKDCVMTAAELCTKLRCKAVQREGRLLEGHTVLQSGDCLERMDAPPGAFSSPGPGGAGPGFRPAPTACLSQRPAPYALPKPDGSPTGSWICWSGPGWTSNIWTALCSRRSTAWTVRFSNYSRKVTRLKFDTSPERSRGRRLLPFCCRRFALFACGGKDVPPEQYSSNDTALPALTSTSLPENIQFSHKEGSEDQPRLPTSTRSVLHDRYPGQLCPSLWRRTAALRLTPTAL